MRTLIVLAAFTVLAHAPPASACLNETILELDELAPHVARAKKALERGDYQAVGKSIARVLPDLQTRADHHADARPLLRRARMLSLAATIRSNGRVVGNKTVDDESARLQRMLESYQGLLLLKGNKQDIEELEAEVMARADNMRAQAKARLEELARADLLASPEAWAALSTLRAHDRDPAGARAAARTCAARALDPRQCAGFRVEAPGRS